MALADDGMDAEQHEEPGGVLRRPVRIPVPGVVRRAVEPVHRELAGKVVSATARILVVVLPTALAVVGLVIVILGVLQARLDRLTVANLWASTAPS